MHDWLNKHSQWAITGNWFQVRKVNNEGKGRGLAGKGVGDGTLKGSLCVC